MPFIGYIPCCRNGGYCQENAEKGSEELIHHLGEKGRSVVDGDEGRVKHPSSAFHLSGLLQCLASEGGQKESFLSSRIQALVRRGRHPPVPVWVPGRMIRRCAVERSDDPQGMTGNLRSDSPSWMIKEMHIVNLNATTCPRPTRRAQAPRRSHEREMDTI